MRRSQLVATMATAITIILGAQFSLASIAEGSRSSTPSANTRSHKASPTRTSSSTASGTHTTNGSRSSRRPAFHAPLHGQPRRSPARTRRAPGVTMPSAAVMAEWAKVNVCEEGGNWHVRGSIYSGGLGIRNANWTYFSRGLGFPASAADAAPWQQVIVAQRIEGGSFVPDQHGCAAW